MRAQNQTDLPQNRIAGGVTETVIDQLEQINVGNRKGQCFASLSSMIEREADVFVQRESIGQTSQRIDKREPFQLLDSSPQNGVLSLEPGCAFVCSERSSLRRYACAALSDRLSVMTTERFVFGIGLTFVPCGGKTRPESGSFLRRIISSHGISRC
jgi:hypothetical protein